MSNRVAVDFIHCLLFSCCFTFVSASSEDCFICPSAVRFYLITVNCVAATQSACDVLFDA